MLALVIVFDPLAVCLAVGFNVALLRDFQSRRSPMGAPVLTVEPVTITGTGNGHDKGNGSRQPRFAATMGVSIVLIAAATGGIAVAAHYGYTSFRHAAQGKHSHLVPGKSFAIATVRPDASPETLSPWTGALSARVFTDLLREGFDRNTDVYLFAKFPEKQADNTDRPVMVAGLVARVTDPVVAEAALIRVADEITAALRPGDLPTPARGRAMIRHGRGRYLDPEGGFFTFGLVNQSAILLVELEGDPQSPIIEREIQKCLNATESRETPMARALVREGVAGVWLDASRFFAALPKNPAAEARYQKLQRFLDFDLVLKFQPTTIVAEYAYKSDRFKDRRQPNALQTLTALGGDDSAGLVGQLMDRCADTLDYDSLIERLRTTLGAAFPTGNNEVVIEKSFTSDREAQFVISTRPAQTTAVPVVSTR